MANKPVHINQILKLTVDRFGKEGDLMFLHRDFVIIVKREDKVSVEMNKFMKIRITKVMPTFALAVFVE